MMEKLKTKKMALLACVVLLVGCATVTKNFTLTVLETYTYGPDSAVDAGALATVLNEVAGVALTDKQILINDLQGIPASQQAFIDQFSGQLGAMAQYVKVDSVVLNELVISRTDATKNFSHLTAIKVELLGADDAVLATFAPKAGTDFSSNKLTVVLDASASADADADLWLWLDDPGSENLKARMTISGTVPTEAVGIKVEANVDATVTISL